jgi:D-3-phosphoglycerate dehydrogenase
VLKNCEFVTLHVPLVEATRNLISRERIKLMKHGAILLNFSRDGIVDNDEVLEGLSSKRLRYYVCDFPAQKLAGHPGVIALPHLGASTREAEDNCAIMVVDELCDYLEHGNIQNAVNFPDVAMSRESPFRVGIANANVPNMLGQISTAMAEAGLNIHNMLNKSKGEMAYTLVDVDSAVPLQLVQHIAAIKGVLVARYLPAEKA